ncbi:MAG: hypothetical protein AB8H80_13265 [Planctomycetota bacterium]
MTLIDAKTTSVARQRLAGLRLAGLLCGLALLASGCDENVPMQTDPPAAATRGFAMGFTPWLPEATLAARAAIYERIQDDGDILAHHVMDGVPWQEAFDQTAYPASVEDDLSVRTTNTRPGKRIYLAIDSLNGPRTELAPNWGAAANEPRTGAWAIRDFDAPEVIAAYGNFAEDLIQRFQPEWFCYAVEIGGLMASNPASYDRFVTFSAAISDRLRTAFPETELMVSLSLKSPGNAEMQTITSGFARIAEHVDRVGISIYPYAFFDHQDKGDPDTMPTDWLSQIETIAPGKPIAITETGWAAEALEIPSLNISLPVSAEDQRTFVARMLQEADDLDAAFVIWFSYADYDELWTSVLSSSAVGRIWRDTGLTDGDFVARPARAPWREWLARPIR